MKRNSNIELLRIISMLLIIMHHIVVHNEIYFSVTGFPNSNTLTIFFSFGKICLNIFAILTGYFMYKKSANIKSAINIYIQMLTVSVVTTLIVYMLGYNPNWIYLFPVLSESCGYGTSYIVIAALSKYINKLIDSVSDKEFKLLISLLLLVFYVLPLFIGRYRIDTTFVLFTDYLIGASIHKFNLLDKFSTKLSFSISGLIYISVYLLSLMNEKFVRWYDSPFITTVLIAMFIVIAVLNIKPSYNKYINTLSSASFMVLLIHDNPLIRLKIIAPIDISSLAIIKIPLLAILIYLICFVIYRYGYLTFMKIINKIKIKAS